MNGMCPIWWLFEHTAPLMGTIGAGTAVAVFGVGFSVWKYRKETKTSEMAARLASAKEATDEYVRYIEDAPNEATRLTRFAMFFFNGLELDLETEKRVIITTNGKTTAGRIDLACGTLVMEFKTSIVGRKLADAEGQLRMYASGLLNAESRDYTLVATDGVRFNVYGYQIADGAPLRPDDVTLFLKSSVDLKRRTIDGDLYADEAVISRTCGLARAESPHMPAGNAQILCRLGYAPRGRRSGMPCCIAGTVRGAPPDQ